MLLKVNNLNITYQSDEGRVRAVRDVSFDIQKGESMGLVGESGCGKSSLSLAIMKLLPPQGKITSGEILFNGMNIVQLGHHQMRKIRGDRMSMIFQDPMTSLNPYMKIGRQLHEVFETHNKAARKEGDIRIDDLLKRVGLSDADRVCRSYAHELSGGMLQRVMIVMALLLGPELLIADEPTTALDVTTQRQILELIKEMQKEMGMGLLLITHDLGVVSGMCDNIAVMYAGEIVETSQTRELFKKPIHPYSNSLLSSIPALKGERKDRLNIIPGLPPKLIQEPAGCSFVDRCAIAEELCKTTPTELRKSKIGRVHRCLFDEPVKNT